MAVEELLASLRRVELQRQARASDPLLGGVVLALKSFQQGRLALTYPDLLTHPRWAAAARFFLDELYGPKDFAERDRGLARVVPSLVRLFPSDVVQTVDRLLQLHAVSEELDTAMARARIRGTVVGLARVSSGGDWTWSGERYAEAWRIVGRRPDREGQVRTVVEIGQQLDRLTRLPGLRQSLRLMRIPASLAGLGALQAFLERGFDAFRAMDGADGFLATIETRELLWLNLLFDPRPLGAHDPAWLGQFP